MNANTDYKKRRGGGVKMNLPGHDKVVSGHGLRVDELDRWRDVGHSGCHCQDSILQKIICIIEKR